MSKVLEHPCYRITRKYKHHGLTKTYTHDYAVLDKAYTAIIRLIDECDHYTFDHHKIVIVNGDGSTVIAELRNLMKPCIIPFNELIASHQTDRKYVCSVV